MAKNDVKTKSDDTTGNLSISKSQKNAAARARKAALAPKVCRGGVCSACGQESTSCTTGSQHEACKGYVENYDFKDHLLNAFGEREAMAADGTILQYPIVGYWISKEELLKRRCERKIEAEQRAKKRVVMTSVFKTDVDGAFVQGDNGGLIFDRLDVTNGLGEPISYLGGAWRTEEEATEYAAALEKDLRAGVEEVYYENEKPIDVDVAAHEAERILMDEIDRVAQDSEKSWNELFPGIVTVELAA